MRAKTWDTFDVTSQVIKHNYETGQTHLGFPVSPISVLLIIQQFNDLESDLV